VFRASQSTNGNFATDVENTIIVSGDRILKPSNSRVIQSVNVVEDISEISSLLVINSTSNSVLENNLSSAVLKNNHSTGKTNFNIGGNTYVEYKSQEQHTSTNNSHTSNHNAQFLTSTEAAVKAFNEGDNGLGYLIQLNNNTSEAKSGAAANNNIATNKDARLFSITENTVQSVEYTNAISTLSNNQGTTTLGGITLFNPLTEIHSAWNSRNSSMTTTGTALVIVAAVAVTAATAGSAGGAASSAAVSAGATSGGVVASAAAGAAAAAVSATAATVAVSAVNNGGNIAKTLKDTTSKESLKNIAIAALAGGIAGGLMSFISPAPQAGVATSGGDGAASLGSTSPTAVPTTSPTEISAPMNTALSTSPSPGSITNVNQLANAFAGAVKNTSINVGSQIAAQSAVNGESVQDAIKNQGTNILLYAAGELAANQIGNAAHPVDAQGNNLAPRINMPTQLALHAGLGCALAAAGGNNCGAGAAAGVIGEATGQYLNNNTQLTREQLIAASQITGALAAATVAEPEDGNSVFAGSYIAANAVRNNAIKVWVQEVAVGNYHTSIKIEPEDQELYKNDPRFKNSDQNGIRFATIGAGPESFINATLGLDTNLISNPNRERDTDLSIKIPGMESSNLVPSNLENQYITTLFRLDNNYKDNLLYDKFPNLNNQNGYNSNSYISGILNAAGITPPQIDLKLPGYRKPVPSKYFGE